MTLLDNLETKCRHLREISDEDTTPEWLQVEGTDTHLSGILREEGLFMDDPRLGRLLLDAAEALDDAHLQWLDYRILVNRL